MEIGNTHLLNPWEEFYNNPGPSEVKKDTSFRSVYGECISKARPIKSPKKMPVAITQPYPFGGPAMVSPSAKRGISQYKKQIAQFDNSAEMSGLQKYKDVAYRNLLLS